MTARFRALNKRFRSAVTPEFFAKPKLAALQHGGSQWLTSTSSVDRNLIADNYDMVMCGIAITTNAGTVRNNFDIMRGRNADLVISQYTQVWETHGKGLYAIELVSGTTYRCSLDNTTDGAQSSTLPSGFTNGASVKIRNTTSASFDGTWTISGVSSTGGVGGRASFTITGVAGSPANENPTTGTCCPTSDSHHTRYDLAAQNGGTAGWWLRSTVGGTANRVRSSGVDAAQRAVNFHSTTTANGSGHYFWRVKADFDKTNIFDPFQPTVGEQLVLWIDNWNYSQRISGYWGAVEGGPVGSTIYTSTDEGVRTRNREALADYADRLRTLYPGVKIIGNADGVTGAATGGINGTAGIRSLDWPEWPVGTLDGAFIENLYGPTSAGAEDTTRIGSAFNDNWIKLQGRLREQRRMVADPGMHVVMVRGRGSTSAAQHADYQFFVIGLVATLMQGNTRAETSYYAFGPVTHDVTLGWVRHDEADAELGEPIEGEQTSARGWTSATTAWARYFENGIIIGNASTTTQITITTSHLAGTSGSSAPHPSGTTYRRINGVTNPFNTGAAVSSSFTLDAKSGCILLRDT